MAKKRLERARHDHATEIRLERERQQKIECLREKRKTRIRKKTRRETLHYRRHMRIDGVVAQNKGHAKKLFFQKLEKRGREMEWEAPEESRPKKKRLVETKEGKTHAVTTLTDGIERFNHLRS